MNIKKWWKRVRCNHYYVVESHKCEIVIGYPDFMSHIITQVCAGCGKKKDASYAEYTGNKKTCK